MYTEFQTVKFFTFRPIIIVKGERLYFGAQFNVFDQKAPTGPETVNKLCFCRPYNKNVF